MEDSFLSQEEIDALLNQNVEESDLETNSKEDIRSESEKVEEILSLEEQDALGEIGNISAGSASTTLSELLNQKVMINTPKVKITTPHNLYENFNAPYVVIEVNYTTGIEGSNILVMEVMDAAIIADLMMGGNGENVGNEIDEIKKSAVSEAMNQMIGSSATSLSTIFNQRVEISPPTVNVVDLGKDDFCALGDEDKDIVVILFNLQIGELLKSEIIQIIPIDIAKQEVEKIMSGNEDQEDIQEEKEENIVEEKDEKKPQKIESDIPKDKETKDDTNKNTRNLDLIMDVPLKVSVLLGKTKKPIDEILSFVPGAIVELEKLADEPVDILVNGTLIAKGEVVVVNENFGVKLTNIISPEKRIKNLGRNK